MLAVKGHYRHGRVELDAPIPGLDEAEVIVVVESATRFASAFGRDVINSPAEDAWNKMDAFEAAGLATFLEGNDDENVDWMEIFDVNGR